MPQKENEKVKRTVCWSMKPDVELLHVVVHQSHFIITHQPKVIVHKGGNVIVSKQRNVRQRKAVHLLALLGSEADCNNEKHNLQLHDICLDSSAWRGHVFFFFLSLFGCVCVVFGLRPV